MSPHRVNDRYREYLEAGESAKGEAEARLIIALKEYARAVCWIAIGEYVEGFEFDMAGEVMTSLPKQRGEARNTPPGQSSPGFSDPACSCSWGRCSRLVLSITI